MPDTHKSQVLVRVTTNLDKSPNMRHKETFCGIAMTQYNIQFNKKLIV